MGPLHGIHASLPEGHFRLQSTRPTLRLDAEAAKSRTAATFPLRAETAGLLREYLAYRAPAAPAFDLPPSYDMAEMLRRDLAAAREAWIQEAGEQRERVRRRQETHFLAETDERGAVLDFHALRVSFITNLARAGVSLQQAQKLARHSDPRLTANVYSKLGDDDQERALAMLPSLEPAPAAETEPETAEARATGTEDAEPARSGAPQRAPRPGAQGPSHAGDHPDSARDSRRNSGGANGRERARTSARGRDEHGGGKGPRDGAQPLVCCGRARRGARRRERARQSHRSDSNRQPTHYKCVALPLSYGGGTAFRPEKRGRGPLVSTRPLAPG